MAVFSTFNPSIMGPDLIEGTLVERQSLAKRLVELFEESARGKSKHNVLLVGPRGIGKSHLVSLVYHRLKASPEGEKLAIAYLREDEWGIASFLDLLVRTTFGLCEDMGINRPDLSSLSKLSREDAEHHVWHCLQELLGTKTLLLIIENLDAAFRKLGEDGQKKWRALMQTHSQWAVLATTPALFSDISRYASPFYGFFEVIHLQALSFNGAVSLLKKLACVNSDDATAVFLDTAVGRARVRAVQHLAGGNHRIFVLFYEFLNQDGSEHFIAPLLKTVDALTPYYQAQMAKLSPQQQKIVSFLCDHQKPATVTTIATNCFTTHQTAAGQLKQLLADRYVSVSRIGRESFYELGEPLFRICVEAKTHREEPLRLLVEFMRYWFTREELERRLSCAGERDPGKAYFAAALREYQSQDAHEHLSPEIAKLCRTLTRNNDTAEQMKATAEELAELSKIAMDWIHYARAMAFLDREDEAIPFLEQTLGAAPDSVETLRALALVHDSLGSFQRADELLDRAITLAPNSGMLFFDKGRILTHLGRYSEALDNFDQAARFDDDLRLIVADQKAYVFIRMKKYEQAREALIPFLSEGDTVPDIFRRYGTALALERKFAEALTYFTKATNKFKNDWIAWINKGRVLISLKRYNEGLKAFDRALTLHPDEKEICHHRCEALLEGRQYDLAVQVTPPEALSHNIFHLLLDIFNEHLTQAQIEGRLLELKNAHDSEAWQKAFIGGLIELLSLAKTFADTTELADLKVWNSALHGLFSDCESFSLLLNLFDVLTRVKVLGDRKALLELPREQRLLIIDEKEEEDFLKAV